MIPYIAKLTKKSDLGDYESKCNLAFEYWSGSKIKQDYKKAFKLWMELANINVPCGLFNIATMYREGYGMKVNTKLAKKYYLLCTKVKINKNLSKNISSFGIPSAVNSLIAASIIGGGPHKKPWHAFISSLPFSI